ncbi:hypothetical protein D3P09_01330 [Paenibacillus pinisoli]|uniref:Uncharacterized protein n=1 Tax=Paenibacillus pinisoli TaxID=1276110 RepID=A0A3A6PMV1_9BACL|nr:hypothetical protein D3P09_01330 [Paenibacillus pinisoli]
MIWLCIAETVLEETHQEQVHLGIPGGLKHLDTFSRQDPLFRTSSCIPKASRCLDLFRYAPLSFQMKGFGFLVPRTAAVHTHANRLQDR